MNTEKLTAKTKDVGGIPVARLLPQGSRRTIGAWCFLDHVGPAEFAENSDGLQVGSHPHTNLQTFTWMLSGEVWHQDSLGFRQLIRPKQVNLMTAGTGGARGIAHTEQTPEGIKQLHAVQLWIALPMHKEIDPDFQHYPELPEWQENGVRYILTTGRFGSHTAPTAQHSPLIGLDIQFDRAARISIPAQAGWEYGVLVIAGSIKAGGQTFTADELAFIETADARSFELEGEAGSHIMLLGGEPLPHPTVVWWNFVADSREALQQAVADWNSGSSRFGTEIDLGGTGLKRLVAPEVPQGLR
ncbi:MULTISPECIES: pirin family protein [unclassified Neisseria]|uniref:pirin family protein n=1 Tax=unclassified Neisseria TaxID=2623750 RepID=UPI0010726DF2|nr:MULTISPECIES: pirin family protein [unclassified Neisseria]MBF0803679.1 pirin family protein [Neisseria sp. 19428wB4_WF04]TFU43589.1 pirin family protein [Neisseria sp. WF04]